MSVKKECLHALRTHTGKPIPVDALWGWLDWHRRYRGWAIRNLSRASVSSACAALAKNKHSHVHRVKRGIYRHEMTPPEYHI